MPNTQTGGTPLHDAASTGKALCVALLVKHGADVSATNKACCEGRHLVDALRATF
jgi:ankyrin repeat protein